MFIIDGIIAIIGAIFGLIVYVLTALGLHTLAKRAGIEPAWIAWIPICQWYLIGRLIGNRIFGIDHAGWILVLAPFVAALIAMVTPDIVGSILTLLVYILEVAAYYTLFKIYKPNSAVLYTISGFIITPLLGLWVFLIRNNPRQGNIVAR